MTSINRTVEQFLGMVKLSRSANTHLTYSKAMSHMLKVVASHHIDPAVENAGSLPEDVVSWMIQSLQYHAPSSERLFLTALTGYFEFLSAENMTEVNIQKVRLLIKQRARKPGIRLPQFPRDAIARLLDEVEAFPVGENLQPQDKLRILRDKAFLITLGETGLRVHEACRLRRADMDWNEGHAIVIGKGNREAVVRFSRRAQKNLQTYLNLRASFDQKSGKNPGALPVFARHDKGAGEKVKPITTTTGRNIVAEWVETVLGKDAVGSITPHSFRHYFVTKVLQVSGNLKLGQELARHKNIAVTQRYAHLSDGELDKGYWEVFEKKK